MLLLLQLLAAVAASMDSQGWTRPSVGVPAKTSHRGRRSLRDAGLPRKLCRPFYSPVCPCLFTRSSPALAGAFFEGVSFCEAVPLVPAPMQWPARCRTAREGSQIMLRFARSNAPSTDAQENKLKNDPRNILELEFQM